MAKDVTYIENREEDRPLSRYNKIRLYVDPDANMVQESWDQPDIPERSDDVFHEVQPGEDHRPDLVAERYYNAPELYWVIAYANEMSDPFAETTAGLRIRIPNRDNLFQMVLIK